MKTIILAGGSGTRLWPLSKEKDFPIKVLAVVDDDKNKQSGHLVNFPIITKENINQFKHDGILISSYKHHETIRKNLVEIEYPLEKILEFFD